MVKNAHRSPYFAPSMCVIPPAIFVQILRAHAQITGCTDRGQIIQSIRAPGSLGYYMACLEGKQVDRFTTHRALPDAGIRSELPVPHIYSYALRDLAAWPGGWCGAGGRKLMLERTV